MDSPTEGRHGQRTRTAGLSPANVRLEPAEAALIKRVIPKGSVRAVTVSLLVEHARELEAQMPTIPKEMPLLLRPSK